MCLSLSRTRSYIVSHANREHLYRVHSTPIQCARCWLTMKPEKDLEEHIRAQSPCLVRPQIVKWVPREKVGILKDRKKVFAGQTEEERWKCIYGILFPDDPILPRPCEFHHTYSLV